MHLLQSRITQATLGRIHNALKSKIIRWLRDSFGPLLGAALRASGGLELAPLISRGLAMGDVVMRNPNSSLQDGQSVQMAPAKLADNSQSTAGSH